MGVIHLTLDNLILLFYNINNTDIVFVTVNHATILEGGEKYETCKDIKHPKAAKHSQKRWMWRMPDFLPVSM